MIKIDTKQFDREDVRQSFLYEFSRMILCGMGEPRKDETIEQAAAIFEEELDFADTDTGFTVGSEDPDYDFTVQDCAFSLASEIFGKNSYSDEFGADQACLAYVGERLLEKYPGIEFFSQTFLDTEWSNTVEIVKTVDGEIVSETEEF